MAIIARSTPTMVCCMNHDAHSSVPLLSFVRMAYLLKEMTLAREPGIWLGGQDAKAFPRLAYGCALR